MIISSTLDFREAARRRLPRFLFDYADGGANNEYTLERNVSDLAEVTLRQRVDPTLVWQDLERIGARWKGPLIIKGILDPDDARAAIDIGADGVVVSNHGGR